VLSDTFGVRTDSAAVSTVVDDQFVQNMPLYGGSFQSLIALAPGVVFTSFTLGQVQDFPSIEHTTLRKAVPLCHCAAGLGGCSARSFRFSVICFLEGG